MTVADSPPGRVFNTPLECGLRLLFVLQAISPMHADLQRLISYDYLLVHSGDVDPTVTSLHPAVPLRGTEWLVKRDLVRCSLDLMYSKELIQKHLNRKGISYSASELTASFTGLLGTRYALGLRTRSEWVARRFGVMTDHELSEFMTDNVGRWGAEFERMTAIRVLELD